VVLQPTIRLRKSSTRGRPNEKDRTGHNEKSPAGLAAGLFQFR
jgi:hypothetical protein